MPDCAWVAETTYLPVARLVHLPRRDPRPVFAKVVGWSAATGSIGSDLLARASAVQSMSRKGNWDNARAESFSSRR
jgi:hypothetical protein